MAATDLLPNLATVLTAVGALVVFASLATLALTLGERLLGTPPPGHQPVGWLERGVAVAFVCFLSIGPLWLIAILSSGGTCT